MFKPTKEPQFVTVSGSKGEVPYAIVLDPGRYTISVKNDKYLFLDYFVLLPAAYYEASILTKKIDNPCELGDLGLCRHYTYPPIEEFHPVSEGLNIEGENTNVVYSNDEHLQLIKSKPLPLLNELQQSLDYVIDVPQPGRYIIVVDYVTDIEYPESYVLKLHHLQNDEVEGFVAVQLCIYATICRQPAVDEDSKEQIFAFSSAGSQSFRLIVSQL